MVAPAFLVVVALVERACHPALPGLIGLTCNEVQHLALVALATPTSSTRPQLPLPATSRPATMNTTIHG